MSFHGIGRQTTGRAQTTLSAGAFLTGVAASGILFGTTVYSSYADTGPGVIAALQALGVFIGSFVCLPFARSGRLSAFAGTTAAVASVLCVLAMRETALVPVAVFMVGLSVGVAVAATDVLAASLRGVGKAASTILKTALFGAVGATLAPILIQLCIVAEISVYIVPAAALLTAGLFWLGVKAPHQDSGPLGAPLLIWPALKPAMILAFLFGFIDNGILSLAPSHFQGAGASGWTLALIGLAAAAGAAIVQLAAVLRVERTDAPPKPLLFITMALAAGCLVVGAFGLQPLAAGLMLVAIGVLIDLLYGLGLVETLRASDRDNIAGAATGYVCACALGEIVGPLVSDFASARDQLHILYLAPIAFIAVTVIAMALRPRRVLAATPC